VISSAAPRGGDIIKKIPQGQYLRPNRAAALRRSTGCGGSRKFSTIYDAFFGSPKNLAAGRRIR
jgi:hypothetical protein